MSDQGDSGMRPVGGDGSTGPSAQPTPPPPQAGATPPPAPMASSAGSGPPGPPMDVIDGVAPNSQPRRWRALSIGLGGVIVIGGGVAFAATQMSQPSESGLADRMPASIMAYAEVNLDQDSQGSKLMDLLGKFDVPGDYEHADDLVQDGLAQLEGSGGIDKGALSDWVGARAAVGFEGENLEEPSAVLVVESTDDAAAESGLSSLVDDAGLSMDYVVDDGYVVIVAGSADVGGKAQDAVDAAEKSSLAGSDRFSADMEWLADDQLLTLWADVETGVGLMTDLMETGLAQAQPGEMPEGMDTDELMQTYTDIYGDIDTFVVGARATDQGVDLRYRATGEGMDLPGNGEWRSDMGELRMGQIAATATFPDLSKMGDTYKDLLDSVEESGLSGTAGEGLTDAEYDEYMTLDEQYFSDTLAAEDEARYRELEQRYFEYGVAVEQEEIVPTEAIDEIIGYLSNGTLTAVVGDIASEQPDFGVEFVVAEGSADSLLDLPIPGWSEMAQDIEGQLEFDGPAVTFGELRGDGDTLSDHELFDTVFDGAPDEASLALFADVAAINEVAPESVEELEPLKAVGFVQGSNGEGLLRIVIE